MCRDILRNDQKKRTMSRRFVNLERGIWKAYDLHGRYETARVFLFTELCEEKAAVVLQTNVRSCYICLFR